MPKIARRDFLKSASAAVLGGGIAMPFVRSALAQGSEAAGFPNRPIKFVVPLAPGGAIDFIARAVGERMSQTVGHQIVVVTQGDLGLRPGFGALEAEFLPSGGRIPRERALKPGKRRASPQRECFAEQL